MPKRPNLPVNYIANANLLRSSQVDSIHRGVHIAADECTRQLSAEYTPTVRRPVSLAFDRSVQALPIDTLSHALAVFVEQAFGLGDNVRKRLCHSLSPDASSKVVARIVLATRTEAMSMLRINSISILRETGDVPNEFMQWDLSTLKSDEDECRRLLNEMSPSLYPICICIAFGEVVDAHISLDNDNRSDNITFVQFEVPVDPDPTQEVQRLATSFVLPDPPKPLEIVRLEEILQSVRDSDIRDRKAFVSAVNRLLRDSGYRCRLPDGNAGLLRLVQPSGPPGYIQFTLTAGGTRGRLGKTPVSLIRIKPEHGIR